MASSAQISLSTCAKMVEHATTQCAASGAPAAPSAPDFNAMAASLAAQNNAIAIGAAALGAVGLVVALGGIIAGIAWSNAVKQEAREAGEEAAKKAASEWMDKQGADLIAEKVAEIMADRGADAKANAEAEADELQEIGDAA